MRHVHMHAFEFELSDPGVCVLGAETGLPHLVPMPGLRLSKCFGRQGSLFSSAVVMYVLVATTGVVGNW